MAEDLPEPRDVQPARKFYREQLDGIKAGVLEMGELALASLRDAIKLLSTRSPKLMQTLKKTCERVDRMEFDLEQRIVNVLALQQPMAGDLRVLTASLRIISDLDRISDQAGNITEIVRTVGDEPWFKPLIDLPRMGELSQEMLRRCLDAYRTGDLKPLEDLASMEDIVDALDEQIRRESITYMLEDPHVIRQASQLSFAARYMERVADHITSIGSRVIYIYTGERRKLD